MKSLKEHFGYLFEEQKKQQILFTLGDSEIRDVEDAVAIILAFNVVYAFLNNESETMLQKAYKGEKVKGNSNTNLNVGKTIELKRLLNPSGLNLTNPNAVANEEQGEVNNVSNVRKFAQLTKDAIEFLEKNDVKSALMEGENVARINKMYFYIEANKLLKGKLKALVDEDNEKINISKLIDYFRDDIENYFKNSEEIKNN